MKTEAWINEFAGRKILIWGFAREGRSSLRWIHTLLPDLPVTVCIPSRELSALNREKEFEPVSYIAQEVMVPSDYDMIIKSAGIVIPEGMDRSNITQQSQLFLKHHRDQTIGITGTKGKSTTASLTHAILSEKTKSHLVGNIGIPCFDILPVLEDNEPVVFEISCHQLEYSPYSPHIGVYLNLYEEHLDHYRDFQAYADAKANVFRHQKEGDTAILNEALPYVKERPDALRIGRDITVNGNTIRVTDHQVEVTDCRLIGTHNLLNAGVAYAATLSYGVSEQQFLKALSEFVPLPHRLEKIAEKNGVIFVNDSISTIGQASIAALKSLPQTEVILIGGMDRGIDYRELEDWLYTHPRLHVIFMYATGKRIYEELKEKNHLHAGMHVCQDLEEAVHTGAALCHPGGILLLSPAASSYDHFRNFEERGEVFAQLVEAL